MTVLVTGGLGYIGSHTCVSLLQAGRNGWKPERDLLQMCRDAWNWQTRNPDGYAG